MTETELCKLLNCTRQTLRKYRVGGKEVKNGKTYTYPSKLIEGVDYENKILNSRMIVDYTESGIEKINLLYKKN